MSKLKKNNFIQPVILAIIRKDGKYLLTKRAEGDPEDPHSSYGSWQIPGGGLEFGESVEECLQREVQEELGIEVTRISMLNQIFHQVRNNWHGIFITFVCEMKDPNVQIKINNEASDYGWFTIEDIKNLVSLPLTEEIINAANL
jgi:8-oxo-dGTP diphosphatase